MYYDHARDVDLNDITSSSCNSYLLSKLLDGRWDSLSVTTEYDSDTMSYLYRDGDDLGWLGYFVGIVRTLRTVKIHQLPTRDEESEQIDELFEGLCRNTSIMTLCLCTDVGDSNIDLGRVVRNKTILRHLDLQNIDLGTEQARRLALGLREISSLRWLTVENCNLNDDGLSSIAASLKSMALLETITLNTNTIGTDGSAALGNVLNEGSFTCLASLDLSRNNINDDGLKALVRGMTSINSLRLLNLSGNSAITVTGLKLLSAIFRSKQNGLDSLTLSHIGDDGAEALAAGLSGNTKLRHLIFTNNGITERGWSAFTNLLCDKSSIHNTYYSNHTLMQIGEHYYGRDCGLGWLGVKCLEWNRSDRSRPRNGNSIASRSNNRGANKARIKKILFSHPDLDMVPLFQYKLKLLPLVLYWLECAASCIESRSIFSSATIQKVSLESVSIKRRKLAAIFNFTRSMPQCL